CRAPCAERVIRPRPLLGRCPRELGERPRPQPGLISPKRTALRGQFSVGRWRQRRSLSASASGRLLEGLRKWYYNAAGFNKLGLMRDDTIYENDDVKVALKRLPENLYNERLFRIKRALDLSMRQQILPEEQWVKYEEDKKYLEPYLKEVIRERLEREEWDKK
uniref:Cytochrome b-c1 complex subunit 7 n=1 Tax=Chelonoidis abingdonii TaxID=106734 RepID=A0A8C0J3G3_CHEAB